MYDFPIVAVADGDALFWATWIAGRIAFFSPAIPVMPLITASAMILYYLAAITSKGAYVSCFILGCNPGNVEWLMWKNIYIKYTLKRAQT